ncbi:hypothetical protein LNP74_22050 [Klebsiella pneumoniae subsp. pneumoniae]|nr:hypothetical protein [Klebsiella pneumoniae subsp. pneumoniae]
MTYSDNGTKRQSDVWKVPRQDDRPLGDRTSAGISKAYLDSGDCGMGTLTSPIVRGKDAPSNARYCWTKPSPVHRQNRPLFRCGDHIRTMPGRNISTWKWANQRQHRTPGSWWCAGSAHVGNATTISLLAR